MAYQMTLTLSEQEYVVLSAEAAKSGKQPEALLHDMIERLQLASQLKRPLTGREFEEKLYREGLIENIQTWQPLTPEEQAERERLGQLFAGGKAMSEM